MHPVEHKNNYSKATQDSGINTELLFYFQYKNKKKKWNEMIIIKEIERKAKKN